MTPLRARIAVISLWLLSLAILLAGLADPPVRRSQEARVLETAREMVATDTLSAWLVPRLNLHVRLEKPPLAYWLSALSFKIIGVNDFAGRLPAALAAWLTLGFTYFFVKRLFGDPRAALASAACLLASLFFMRFALLAETDGLSMLFVTAGIYFGWLFIDDVSPECSLRRRDFLLAHASAISIGLAVLAKGPPAAFVVIFLIAAAVATRRWRRLAGWCLTGAPITAAVIALPWFIYIRWLPEWSIVEKELRIALEGKEHAGPFYEYVPQMLLAVAPWCGFLVMGLIAAIASARRDARPRALLCWTGAILLPLSVIGQKQPHYLVPILPALAALSGWIIAMSDRDDGLRKPGRFVMAGTACAMVLCGAAVIVAATRVRGSLITIDYVLSVAMTCAGAVAIIALRSRGVLASALAAAVGVSMCLVIFNARWRPTVDGDSARDVAAQIHHRGLSRPYCFFGPNQSLPLAWELRSAIPWAQNNAEFEELSRRFPGVIAIAQNKNDKPPLPPPPGYIESKPPIACEEQTFHFYVQCLSPSPGTPEEEPSP